MKSKFIMWLDGGEARMIVAALCEKSLRETGLGRDMNWILATRIDNARHLWHEEARAHIEAGGAFGEVAAGSELMDQVQDLKKEMIANVEAKK